MQLKLNYGLLPLVANGILAVGLIILLLHLRGDQIVFGHAGNYLYKYCEGKAPEGDIGAFMNKQEAYGTLTGYTIHTEWFSELAIFGIILLCINGVLMWFGTPQSFARSAIYVAVFLISVAYSFIISALAILYFLFS